MLGYISCGYFYALKKKKSQRWSLNSYKFEMVSVYAGCRNNACKVWNCSLQTGKTCAIFVLVVPSISTGMWRLFFQKRCCLLKYTLIYNTIGSLFSHTSVSAKCHICATLVEQMNNCGTIDLARGCTILFGAVYMNRKRSFPCNRRCRSVSF